MLSAHNNRFQTNKNNIWKLVFFLCSLSFLLWQWLTASSPSPTSHTSFTWTNGRWFSDFCLFSSSSFIGPTQRNDGIVRMSVMLLMCDIICSCKMGNDGQRADKIAVAKAFCHLIKNNNVHRPFKLVNDFWICFSSNFCFLLFSLLFSNWPLSSDGIWNALQNA